MKKNLFIFICLLFTVFLCAASDGVKLRDNKKLIDLDKAIDTKPGGSSFFDVQGENGGTSSSPAKADPSSVGDTSSAADDTEIRIVVHDTDITYNGKPLGTDSFKEKLGNDHKRGCTFVLVDDYAAAKQYKNVRKTFISLKEDMGLSFTETTSDETEE